MRLVARLALLVSCRSPKIRARVQMASSCWSPMDGKGVAGYGTFKACNRLCAAYLVASAEESAGIGCVGENLTVSMMRSALVFGLYMQ